ncbi:DUF6153 family protein [Streptomyces sp. ODS28]|uniref:DUF6153 family protein n=1 Tax=Streptomyces sp. ODS28 TaxID=3136688 RepID=UPI0031E5D420
MRAGRGGGVGLRWVYGVLGILCVAFALLVHHTFPGTNAAEGGTRAAPTPAQAPAVRVVPSEGDGAHAVAARHHVPPKHPDTLSCCTHTTQLCAAPNIDSVQLLAPDRDEPHPYANQAAAQGASPASAVGRAPPDLFLLSLLRR